MTMSKTKFSAAFIESIIQNANHYYIQNTDEDRFGSENLGWRGRLKRLLGHLIVEKGGKFFRQGANSSEIEKLGSVMSDLEEVYGMLGDEMSRNCLVQVMTYRVLGSSRFKFPENSRNYWLKRRSLDGLISKQDKIKNKASSLSFELSFFDLEPIGYPIKLYNTRLGIHLIYITKQYSYTFGNAAVCAEKGDVVIDLGGCFGDTALYFANEVGSAGRVMVYGFIPSNIEVMLKNLELNPLIKERVEIIEFAAWSSSGLTLYGDDNGPGSYVSFDKKEGLTVEVETLSIDDMVRQRKLERVDFIKADIEGAELQALRGAEDVLRTYKPKLAIALYHRLEDFAEIPKYIASLNLGYKMYMRHCSVYGEETMLYATTK